MNGFNIGRYHQVLLPGPPRFLFSNLHTPQAGPQKTLYIPGPLLQQGENQIVVFENYLGEQVRKLQENLRITIWHLDSG